MKQLKLINFVNARVFPVRVTSWFDCGLVHEAFAIATSFHHFHRTKQPSASSPRSSRGSVNAQHRNNRRNFGASSLAKLTHRSQYSRDFRLTESPHERLRIIFLKQFLLPHLPFYSQSFTETRFHFQPSAASQ